MTHHAIMCKWFTKSSHIVNFCTMKGDIQTFKSIYWMMFTSVSYKYQELSVRRQIGAGSLHNMLLAHLFVWLIKPATTICTNHVWKVYKIQILGDNNSYDAIETPANGKEFWMGHVWVYYEWHRQSFSRDSFTETERYLDDNFVGIGVATVAVTTSGWQQSWHYDNS